ncbi:cytochrome P450 2U1-like [Branchiostoma lanceolatum]|uniref:cytochrome P450 2U1-like n=1 Tax=Branchiostoma lanceolatum TaxID=7740 RepID=UPI0034531A34
MSALKLIATVIHEYTNFTTVFLAVFVFLLMYKLFQTPRNLPPGPRPWPLIGNLLSLSHDSAHLQYVEWARQYGAVFTIFYGPVPVIVINGIDTIQEALINNRDIFSDRPRFTDGKGIIMAHYGPFWKEQRKFTMSGLRDFGFGKRSLEGKILEEAEALKEDIIKTDGRPFNIKNMLRKAVTNVICSIVFGARHDYEDSAFQTFLEDIDVRFTTPFLISQFSPVLRHLPLLGQSAQRFHVSQERGARFLKMKADEHQRDFDSNDIRDFVDIYIKEIRSGQNENFTDAQLLWIINDLIAAGTDTTSQSLYWILLYMVTYPDVQERAHQEISRALGDSTLPTTAKRTELPFMDAVISEVMRINAVTPLTVPHFTSSDAAIHGYDIPKGTMVLVNLWSVLRDPSLWKEPDQFNPERFLDNQGQYMKKDALIPFSIGRRSCLGAQLAKMELFVFTTYLLQQFTFKLAEGAPPPSAVGRLGLTNGPSPYELCAIPK